MVKACCDFRKEFFGDYRIIKRMDQDPWSESLLAEHRFIKKKYLLRLLGKDLLDHEGFFNDFQELISRMVGLSHDGLMKIENVSSHDGRYFLVSSCKEEVDSMVPLSQYVLGSLSPLSEREVVSILESLADILDYAYSKGVCHGQLHPDRILLERRGEHHRVFIKDLGLASLIQKYFPDYFFRGERERGLVQSAQALYQESLKGIAFCSPYYGSCNARVEDQYAFGALAYFLLFKRCPSGMFMDTSALEKGEYDWKEFFERCLKPFSLCEEVEELDNLSSLLLKRIRSRETMERVSLTVEDSVKGCQEGVFGVDEIEPTQALVREVLPSRQEADFHTQEFVLVEARSIDEAMDTSVGEDLEGDGYSGVIRSIFSREPVVSHYKKFLREEVHVEPLQSEMVLISGGEFLRGSDKGNRDETPEHKVILDSFFIDVHPVTNEQFVRFLEYCQGDKERNLHDLISFKESRIRRTSGKPVIETGYANHPVVGVTWYGAMGYAEWVGKRLPTEAEWEVAALGGGSGVYPVGDNLEKSDANFFSSDTTAVKSYAPNGYGLYDMAGNVYEWCADWYGYDYYESSSQEPYSPKGPIQGVYRVLRGGCWKSLREDLRVSHRHRNNPGACNSTYGFRCAKDVR